jgi:hypothetical protein
MGYFSNGTEGMDYEARFCDRCVHQKPEDGGCAVWLAHMLYNYEQCNNDDSILHILIPRSKDKLRNEQCAMFHEDKSRPEPSREDLLTKGTA